MAGRLVTIATFDQAAQAHLARSALEAAGISVTLNNEESSALFGPVTNALGGIRLVVREEDEEAAVKILDATFGSEEPVDDVDLAEQAESAEPEDAVDAAKAAKAPEVDPAADSAAREKAVRVALQVACIGLVFPLATPFALVMALQASHAPGELSPQGQRRLFTAALLTLLSVVLFGLTVLLILFGGGF
jgi:hypothetical protein